MFATVGSVAVLAIGGCASGVGGAGAPPVLRIDSPDFRFTTDSSMPMPDNAVPMYVDSSVLPTALMRAQVWTWPAGPPPAHEVAVLASELGLAGDPRRVADGWQVATSGAVLRVYDDAGWPWFYTTEKTPAWWLDQTCEQGGIFGPYFTCNGRPPAPPPSPPPSGSPWPTISAPGADQARPIAQPLLTSLGVTGPVVVRGIGNDGITTLDVPASFQGVPTGGFPIEVQVDTSRVVSAAGPLASPKPGEAYPLISAEQAFELSNGLMPAQCFAEPAPAPSTTAPPVVLGGCQPWHSQSLTGALLGLHMQWQPKHPILLPAWFFTVEDGKSPVLATVAIDRAYLILSRDTAGTVAPPGTSTTNRYGRRSV